MQLNFLAKLLIFGERSSARPARKLPDDLLLKSIWLKLRADYFPDRADLDQYLVRWSGRRQRRVLASVSIVRKFVSVAKELSHLDHYGWLEPLLYHEMCHAVLGENVETRRRKRQWHGREFKSLEKIHPGSESLNAWIKAGGWTKAVRSSRARETWRRRGCSRRAKVTLP